MDFLDVVSLCISRALSRFAFHESIHELIKHPSIEPSVPSRAAEQSSGTRMDEEVEACEECEWVSMYALCNNFESSLGWLVAKLNKNVNVSTMSFYYFSAKSPVFREISIAANEEFAYGALPDSTATQTPPPRIPPTQTPAW